jgi:hypothetical protein
VILSWFSTGAPRLAWLMFLISREGGGKLLSVVSVHVRNRQPQLRVDRWTAQ